ncbi:MAG TPA: tRNA uridine-5-carboxymethylaminomethyl(34) synthesis GTPase MnmE, partial [Steroidobacteraceae bacterium]
MIDTIAAAATPPGRGGIAIVRLSGPATPQIGQALLGTLPSPRVATRAMFRGSDGCVIDHGLALYFPAPHSYTGEQVLELHGHGGPVLVEALMRRLLELGARRAQPGEFTQRAYLNEKLDLAQAEAVADLIDAASDAAARAALRSLAGEFSSRVLALSDALAELRAQVEAG